VLTLEHYQMWFTTFQLNNKTRRQGSEGWCILTQLTAAMSTCAGLRVTLLNILHIDFISRGRLPMCVSACNIYTLLLLNVTSDGRTLVPTKLYSVTAASHRHNSALPTAARLSITAEVAFH
jgi:hypothetical protein